MIYTIQCIASAFNNSVFPSALLFPHLCSFHSLASLMFILLFILAFAFLDSYLTHVLESLSLSEGSLAAMMVCLMPTSSPQALVGIVWMYSQNFIAQDLWSSWVNFFLVSLAIGIYLLFPGIFEVKLLSQSGMYVQKCLALYSLSFVNALVTPSFFPCFCYSHVTTKSFFVGQK